MATVPQTLRPQDGAEMLALAAQMDERRDRKDAAKRELTRAFLHSPVLLAGGLADPLVTPSTETGVLLAFTDQEAAEAWTAERRPEAPRVGWEVVPAAGDERAARSLWLDRLEAARAAVICVNPHGPMSFLVYHQELTEWRLRLRRGRPESGTAPWLDLDERARERERLRGLVLRLEEVVASGRLASMEALAPELGTRHAFGSLHLQATIQLLLARWRLLFKQYYDGIYELSWTSITLARLGDPWSAVDGLLETAQRIRELHAEGVEDPAHPDFLPYYWRRGVQALPQLTIPYREEERAALGPEIDEPPRSG